MKHITALALLSAASLAQPLADAAPANCEAQSGPRPPTVVELYTSEGCSSCPPADRWLSTLKGRDDVLALAFHVDYWDRLGWTDRFASPAATARQYQLARAAGGSSVYTPQVLADGRDWRRWPGLPATSRSRQAADSPPTLKLRRDGNQITVEVGASTSNGPAAQLAGYWAVLEDGHHSRVLAGENRGETLRHDHVVRHYQPVPGWPAAQAQRFELAALPGAAEFPRRVAFVVTDASGRQPLQSLALSCPATGG